MEKLNTSWAGIAAKMQNEPPQNESGSNNNKAKSNSNSSKSKKSDENIEDADFEVVD